MALIVLNNLTELYNMYQITIAFNFIILIIKAIHFDENYLNLIAKTSWHTYWKFRMKSKISISISIWNESLVLPITGTWRYKYVTLFLTIKQYTLYLIKQKVHIAASLSILTSLFSKKLQNACTRMRYPSVVFQHLRVRWCPQAIIEF